MSKMNYADRDLALLTDHDRAGWMSYARSVADEMFLRDWEVHIASGPSEDKFLAQEQCTYGHRSIVIFLSDRFLRMPPEEQRHTIVHELVHAIVRPVEYLTFQNCETDSKERIQLFYSLHKEAMEQVVDHFAMIVAQHVPLPVQYAKYVETGQPVDGLPSIMRPYDLGSLIVKGNAP